MTKFNETINMIQDKKYIGTVEQLRAHFCLIYERNPQEAMVRFVEALNILNGGSKDAACNALAHMLIDQNDYFYRKAKRLIDEFGPSPTAEQIAAAMARID